MKEINKQIKQSRQLNKALDFILILTFVLMVTGVVYFVARIT